MKNILKKDNNHVVFNSLLFTLLVLSYFFMKQHFSVTKFEDRIIGSTVLNNVNTISFINVLSLSLFIIFPTLFFLSFKVMKKMYENSAIDICKFNKKLSMFGIISYCFGFFNFLNTREFFSSFFVAFILFSITILNLVLYKFYKKKGKAKDQEYLKLFEWSVLISIPITIVFSLFMHKIHLFNFNNYILFIIIYLCAITCICWFCKKLDFDKLSKSSIIFLISMIIHPLFLELYNILNQYNIIIPHKSLILMFLYFILFIGSVIYYKRTDKSKKIDYKKYFFVIIIIGLSLLSATNGLINIIDTDFFESANHGLSIYELFKYNKIPIIENFDAHMISNEVLGVLYGILNHDVIGAAFNIYDSYKFVILCLLMYFMIKAFIGKDYAFLCVLVIPFIKDSSLYIMMFGLISIYFFLNAINKKNFKSFLLLWLSLALACVWRLDVGFSISMACMCLLIYLLILDHKEYNIKSIIISFLSIAFSFLLFYVLVCFIKDINPITRLIEFLKICLSNNNWALSSTGNPNTYSYYLYYYILPITAVLSLLYLLYSKYNKYDNQSLILILLVLFYIFNFQRGLVRHSLFENTLNQISNYIIIYFSLYIYCIKYKNSKIIPVLIYSILLVFCSFTINSMFDNYNSLATNFINKELDYVLEDQFSDVKVDRIVLSDKMKSEYCDLDKVLSLLLKKDETYLDFSNQTLLYALLDYEKPVYINQSPGLLSGESTQQMFINEIKRFKGEVPVAIKISSELDGVPNDFRYYLISEYIYNNYVLLSNVNNYEIWIKKSFYEKAKNILDKNNIKVYKNADMTYKFKLDYIPYVWGKEKVDTKVIEKLDIEKNNDKFAINIKKYKINKAKGNYLVLNIDNSSKTKNVILNVMSKSRIVNKLKFKVAKGKNNYKIRISSLYAWYFDNVDGFELIDNSKLKLNDAYISYGDTLKSSE